VASPRLSEAMAREAVEAVRQHGSVMAAARAMEIPRGTLEGRLRAARLQGIEPGVIVHPAPAGHRVKGVSTLYDAGGNIAAQWVKTAQDGLDIEEVIATLRGAFEEYTRPGPPSPPPVDADSSLATIFPVSDAHFGLYAHAAEAGEDYDLKIADSTNRAAFARLMASTPPSGQAVILGLGDLLHGDDSTNRTPQSGHTLDVDTRYGKVLQVAILYLIHAVDLALSRHARVIVRNLAGNHDPHASLAVTMALWAWYRSEPRVTVDTDPSYFWWWRFGSTLLGATHGDQAKMAQLPLVMAASRPVDWGQTKHRLVLTGHVHHKSAIETGGVIVESFQSTAARDAWHSAAGFRSGRSMTSITLHHERGEIARSRVNIG